MSGIYDFSLAVGASQRFSVIGNKVKIISCSQSLPVKIRLDGGDAFPCLEGQGVVKEKSAEFGDVTLFNASTLTLTGTVFIGDSAFEDTRITGTVRVIDQGYGRTLAGQAFTALIQTTAGAGTMPQLQFMNPAGSGKVITIKAVRLSSTLAGQLFIGFWNTLLANLSASVPTNKKQGGPASVMTLRTEIPVTPAAFILDGAPILANTPFQIVLQEPIMLYPAQGFSSLQQVNNATLTTSIEFFEEAQ